MERAQKIAFNNEPGRPGVLRADWHGGPFTIVQYTYYPGAVFPSHHHDPAQVTVILSGRIIFEIEGEAFTLDPGECLFVPGGVPHSARVPEDRGPVVSINVFHPPRKEHP